MSEEKILEGKMKEKKRFYKRWWFWLIVAILFIGVVSSGDDQGSEPTLAESKNEVVNKESNEENEDQDSNAEEDGSRDQEENVEFYIGDRVEMGDYVLQVTDIERSDGNEFNKPQDGKEYVIVHVTIENNGDNEISYNPFNFKMKNSNGQIEDMTFTTIDQNTALSSGELASGGHVSGTITFEQPKGDEGLQLLFEPSFWTADRIVINLQ